MNDDSSKLESRLAQLRPRSLSPTLADRVASELAGAPHPRHGNRFFWAAIAGGAIAASIIVGVFVNEPVGPRNPSPALTDHAGGHNSFTTLARADGRWGDELKLASYWSRP